MGKDYKCLAETDFAINGNEFWAASKDYTTVDWVRPVSPNGYIYECTTAGRSGASAPTWPTTPSNTVSDGTAVWTCRAFTPTYVVPASTKTYIGKIRLNNIKAGTVNVSIYILPNSGGSVNKSYNKYRVWNIALEAGEQAVFGDAEFPDIMENENDALMIFGSLENAVTYRISGIEET